MHQLDLDSLSLHVQAMNDLGSHDASSVTSVSEGSPSTEHLTCFFQPPPQDRRQRWVPLGRSRTLTTLTPIESLRIFLGPRPPIPRDIIYVSVPIFTFKSLYPIRVKTGHRVLATEDLSGLPAGVGH